MSVLGFNARGAWAIFKNELMRAFRTWIGSIFSPVLTTSLYFIVFGAAIGGRINQIDGVSYGAFIVPGLLLHQVDKGLAQLGRHIGGAPRQFALCIAGSPCRSPRRQQATARRFPRHLDATPLRFLCQGGAATCGRGGGVDRARASVLGAPPLVLLYLRPVSAFAVPGPFAEVEQLAQLLFNARNVLLQHFFAQQVAFGALAAGIAHHAGGAAYQRYGPVPRPLQVNQ